MTGKAAYWMAVGVAALLTVPAGAADDDLAVVRKAVASPQAASPPPATVQEESPAPALRKTGKPEPQWLRVRTFSKDGKGEPRKRVSVNLPLSLVRALDDFPIDLCRHGRRAEAGEGDGRRCEVRLADVLSSLETGQELVEVEGEGETVRIWVE